MLDFNNESEQKARNYGPVPAGSRVLMRLTVEKPNKSVQDHEYISESQKTGLRGLWAKYEVAAGSFEGVFWYENLWLPVAQQIIRLKEGQTTACNMGGTRIRAIIEACRRISPKDNSPNAGRKRQISDWLDLSGMEFPARLGIAKDPYKGKNGNIYWNNTVTSVLTQDSKEFLEIANGGEVITDGPVVGKNATSDTAAPQSDGFDYDKAFPPEQADIDQLPF